MATAITSTSIQTFSLETPPTKGNDFITYHDSYRYIKSSTHQETSLGNAVKEHLSHLSRSVSLDLSTKFSEALKAPGTSRNINVAHDIKGKINGENIKLRMTVALEKTFLFNQTAKILGLGQIKGANSADLSDLILEAFRELEGQDITGKLEKTSGIYRECHENDGVNIFHSVASEMTNFVTFGHTKRAYRNDLKDTNTVGGTTTITHINGTEVGNSDLKLDQVAVEFGK
ncbi:hypothetical protein AB751O23_AY_00040 [Chlamydiales bacterium SCGC AB-751-O23]|jgi:hypothetical protein|nr:hypothetical protein AB751O23_AY_00040 [Chlamydiales bacterium SCGC AB-751-O23]